MTNSAGNQRVWGIRAGKGGEAHDLFLTHEVIALADAALGDLTKLDATRAAFYAAYRERHPAETRVGSAGIGSKYFRFTHDVKVGDLIVYPALSDKNVYVGKVTGLYSFNESTEFPHQRTVPWEYVISKGALSQSARYELGAARTFFEFKRHKAELLKTIDDGAVERFSRAVKPKAKRRR